MEKKMKVKSFTAALLFAVASSVAVPSAALSDPGRAAPTNIPPPSDGQGQVIFWRSGTMVGAAMGCGVNIGKERISALGAGRYFVMNTAPGAYEFNAKSEAKDVLNLEVEPGGVHVVKCTIKMGFMAGRPNLAPSTIEEFNARKDDLKYVDSDDIGTKVLTDPGK
jgi:hypothetical protein